LNLLKPVEPRVNSVWSLRLNLICDEVVSTFAFKFNLRRYTEATPQVLALLTSGLTASIALEQVGGLTMPSVDGSGGGGGGDKGKKKKIVLVTAAAGGTVGWCRLTL
jgi:hypothetical protein